MNKNNQTILTIIFAFTGFLFGLTAAAGAAQAQPNLPNEKTKQLVSQLETNVDRFELTLNAALDDSPMNGTEMEDRVMAHLNELERSTDWLESRVDDGPIAADVSNVLGDAFRIETFLVKNEMPADVRRDWTTLKNTLDQLARIYNVQWVWSARNYPPLTEEARQQVISRLENRADDFRTSFDDALDRTRADGKPVEEHMISVVNTFERSLDDLDNRAGRRDEINEKNVLIVLNNALAIEEYMRKYQMTPRARIDWAQVKTQLDDLARIYNVTWAWTVKPGGTTLKAADATKPKQQ